MNFKNLTKPWTTRSEKAPRSKRTSIVDAAAAPVVEKLEDRWMMAAQAPTLYIPATVASLTFQSASPLVPTLTTSKTLLVFNSVAKGYTGAGASQTLTLKITNTGTAALTLGTGAFSVVNDPTNPTQDAALFKILNASSAPASLAPGKSFGLTINYTASAVGRNAALLQIASNDPADPTATVQIHGIGTSGLGGTNEPSLTRILLAYDIPTQDGEQESDTLYPVNPDAPTQEVPMQLLQAANPGQPVTITDLADFTDQTNPAYRFGYYDPSNPSELNELFYITKGDSQSTSPTPQGATSFSPGSGIFGLYFQSPLQDNGKARIGYSQSAYNTWDTTQQQKFRFFPMENPDGSIVPNTFIVTTTEWNAPVGYDFHNIVAIIHNVKAAPTASGAPVLALSSAQFAPSTYNLLFNRIQIQPTPAFQNASGQTETPPNNNVNDTDTLVINNTGDQPLVINSLTLSAPGQWQLVNPPAIGTSIAPGAALDVTVKFVAQSEPNTHGINETDGPYNPTQGGVWSGTLTIGTNDPTHPKDSVNLEGWWQDLDEHDEEPSLQTITNMMSGYTTNIAPPNTNELTQSSVTSATYYGEEVVSDYWAAADPAQQVSVETLAAWHTQGNTQTLAWYPQGSPNAKSTLFVESSLAGQSFFPTAVVNGQESTILAANTFSSTGNFGFCVDGFEYSDDSLTPQNEAGFGPGAGHVLRFYPLRLANGSLVPNTYLMCLDYNATPGQNADFQDGVYIVSNVKPVTPPAAPIDLAASTATSAQGGGVNLQWAQLASVTAAVEYNVYRSSSVGGTYTLLTTTPISSTSYQDTTAVAGQINYYQVTTVNPTTGVQSAANGASALAPPMAPAGLAATIGASGVSLTWTANTETDLAGYNVYRSLSPSTGFTLLSSSPVTAASFTDSSAPAGVTSYYLVTAVDTGGNESAASGTTAVASGATPLGVYAPGSVTASVSASGITLAWSESANASLAGFNVYSSTSASGPFTLLNTAGPLPASQLGYVDTTAASGVPMYYQITSVDTGGNQSQPSYASAEIPALPTPPATVTATGATGGITVNWTAGTTSDIAGYNLYSSASPTGGFVKLNSSLLPASQLTYTDASPAVGVTMYYEVTTVDSLGRESGVASAHAAVPYPAPSAPTGVKASGFAGNVTISWSAVSVGDLVGYNVYRSTSATGVFTLLNSAGPVTTTTYFDATAPGGATLYYQVVAVDSLARSSAAGTASVTTPSAPPAPAAPANLAAQGQSLGVVLTWSPNTEGDITGYQVYRSLSATSGFSLLANVAAASAPTYTDSTAAAGVTWYYEVTATDSLNRVSPVATVNVVRAVDGTPPAAVAGLAAVSSIGQAKLSWSANSELDLTGYVVYRSSSPNGGWQAITGVQTGTTYNDSSAPIGVVSYYEVVAVNSSNVASASGPVVSATALRDAAPPPAPLLTSVLGEQTGNLVSFNLDATGGAGVNDVIGYLVYRSGSAKGKYTRLNATLLTTGSYLDTTAKVGQKVFYKVIAVNSSSVLSSFTKPIAATRPKPPKAPKPAKVAKKK